MRHRLRVLVLFTASVLLSGASDARAQPVPDSTVMAAQRAFVQGTMRLARSAEGRKERESAADAAMEHLGVERLSGVQYLKLGPILAYTTKTEAITNRLRELSKKRGADGAAALLAIAEIERRREGGTPLVVLEEALAHEGAAALARSTDAGELVSALSLVLLSFPFEQHAALAEPVATLIERELCVNGGRSMASLLDAYDREEVSDEVRQRIAGATTAAVKRWRREMADDDVVRRYSEAMGNSGSTLGDPEHLQTVRAYAADTLQELAARAETMVGFLDKPAPELTLEWLTVREGRSEIAELKGKIVVIVHWYRWDGADSTALMNGLAARFKGRPVDVVGVCELLPGPLTDAGRVIDPGGTRDEQAARIRAMAMEQGITTPIALVTKQNFRRVYGAKFGGSTVVIDAGGVVRARRPFGRLDDIAPVVESLLESPHEPAPKR